ncbi:MULTISPECIES: ABC transporter substrate-binding protein [unclassified Salinicola]|uniref:ABC transporter substrate-binding protein n=1 Tax=unclassified Salinicola TaxID=2634022 RepID=UPI001A8F46E5|nr:MULTISPECIES: ABC transporter substrate-binding protein [unclassified Salinicola]MCE3027240.1 ABC transporter substrate-binding protein [Salinicola sp. DM10]WIX33870.1 ABC transporter substrate-binding protein [Salinicola sp. JS01]
MRRLTLPHYCLTLTTLGLLAAGPAHADLDQVRFGVSPWPGVTVKTEIAAQLLDAMGYRTEQKELAVGVILNGLANGQLDAYLGNWYPVQQEMTEPLLESGRLAHAAANISNANSGLVVPAYVHEAGVDSVADLDRYRERFGGKIQGIEAGTGINDAILKAIAEDKAGLGDWQLQESSTAAMLAYAGQKIADHEWVTFVGWEPHWMNVNYDLYYLKDADDSGVADIVSTVWTLVPGGLEQQDANLYRFFSQYRVDIADQNDWVYQYSHEERPADEVASEWIQSHEATVAKWLEGVTAKNGKPAINAVRAEFAN